MNRFVFLDEGFQGIAKRCTRRDAKLREDAVEVAADRAVRQKQLLTDLFVRETYGREFGDLKLLRRERVTLWFAGSLAPLTARSKFICGSVRPWRRAEALERLKGCVEMQPRLPGRADPS